MRLVHKDLESKRCQPESDRTLTSDLWSSGAWTCGSYLLIPSLLLCLNHRERLNCRLCSRISSLKQVIQKYLYSGGKRALLAKLPHLWGCYPPLTPTSLRAPTIIGSLLWFRTSTAPWFFWRGRTTCWLFLKRRNSWESPEMPVSRLCRGYSVLSGISQPASQGLSALIIVWIRFSSPSQSLCCWEEEEEELLHSLSLLGDAESRWSFLTIVRLESLFFRIVFVSFCHFVEFLLELLKLLVFFKHAVTWLRRLR